MERLKLWSVRLLAGFGALVIGIIILAAIVGAFTRGGDGNESSSKTEAQPSPTLTSDELAYMNVAATAAAMATGESRAHAQETFAARPTSPPLPTSTPVPPPYKLALISRMCNRSASTFIECKGFVRNLTNGSLENVEAVVVYTDAAGTPLASDDALIDYNPLLAGQESPWSVIGTYNPAYEKFRVEFRELFGGSILTRYDVQ